MDRKNSIETLVLLRCLEVMESQGDSLRPIYVPAFSVPVSNICRRYYLRSYLRQSLNTFGKEIGLDLRSRLDKKRHQVDGT